MAYATSADLGALLAPEPAPANAERLLARASRIVDGALTCAVYDVGVDGNPTDPAIITALKDATCEQAAFWIQTGDDEGITAGTVASAQIGSVSLSRGGSGGGSSRAAGSGGGLCEQAWQILFTAGLLNFEPWAW